MPSHSLQLKLFRREAVEAAQFHALGRLPVRTSPGLVAVVCSAIVAGVLIAMAAILIEVPERVRVAGLLMPEGKLLVVHATRAGVIGQLAVRDGDWVYRGQPLLRIGEQHRATGALSTNASRRASIERELALLEKKFVDDYERAVTGFEFDRQQHRLLASQLDARTAELASRQRLLDVRTRRLDRAAKLVQRDALGPEHLDQLREAELQARAALRVTEQATVALRAELNARKRSITVQAAEPGRVQTAWQATRETLLRQLDVLVALESEPLTAPDGGVVAALMVRTGSAVRPGQLLLHIADPENPLIAFMYVGREMAGRFRVGQHVELRMHGFPYQRYGTLRGTVSTVAGVPVPATSVGLDATTGDVYEVRARIDAGARDAYSPWTRLPHGASFSADIVRHRWPLYRWAARALTEPA